MSERRVVQLFAVARDLAGRGQVEVDFPAGGDVAALRLALLAEVPALQPIAAHLRIALDADFAAEETVVPAGCEIAVIPPVSGG